MKKFELFLGSLGNGITVCNKAITENGDYKHIAHIAECGKITWYVNPNSIPAKALLKIEHISDTYYNNWNNELSKMTPEERYEKLLDRVPINIMLYAMNEIKELSEKIEYLKKVCYEKSYF